MRKTTGELRGKPVDYDRVLTDMMSHTIQRFIDGLKNDKYQSESVVKLDSLIRDFYFSDKNNVFLKLMQKSQDFIFDVKTLLGDTIDNTGHNMAETIYDTIFDDDMIVFRNSKTLYRIGAQLYGLRNDEYEKLADDIEEFILKEYKNTNINSYIKDLWTAFMTIYSGNLKNKNKEKIEEFLKKLKENLYKTVQFRNISGSFIMDAYTLSRMFRVFKNKNHKKPSKVIVYTGAFHTQTYVKFFQTVLGSNIVSYENYKLEDKSTHTNIDRCLNVNLSYFLDF